MGKQTPEFLYHRPDGALLEGTLQQAGYRMVAVVVRLAWQLGLLRQEIHQLTWEQVDFSASVVRLPDREIPMSPEMQVYLQGLQVERRKVSGPVVLSDRDRRPPAEQHLSLVVRRLMESSGQEAVRLLDLRYDYIDRQLQHHSWEYVSQVAGMDLRSLRLHFSKPEDSQTEPQEETADLDAQKLQKLIEGEGYSAVAVALRLAWQAGVSQTVMHQLQWDMVDWSAGILEVDGQPRQLSEDMMLFLRELERRNHPWSDYILLSDRAHRKVDPAHLSRMVRSALVRGGCAQVRLSDLRKDWEIQSRWAAPIRTYLEHHGRITRRQIMELLHLSGGQVNRIMQWMLERGLVVLSGRSYYLAGTVVPPEQQEAVVLAYLANHPGARCGQLGSLLGLTQKHCLSVLQRLLERGVIQRKNSLYYLPERK